MKKTVITTIILVISTSNLICQNKASDLILKLEHGIELKAKPAYPNEEVSTYNFLEIFQNEKLIYKDESLTEYTIEDSLYPKLYKFKYHLELLIEIDGRPNKNEVRCFLIKNQKLEKIDTLPTFLTRPKDLDNDKKLEYAGFWQFGETWGDKNEVTGYNPIVFYELTENGIVLDSVTTKKVNSNIYGEFKGFYYNEQIEIPNEKMKDFSAEIERILKK